MSLDAAVAAIKTQFEGADSVKQVVLGIPPELDKGIPSRTVYLGGLLERFTYGAQHATFSTGRTADLKAVLLVAKSDSIFSDADPVYQFVEG